MEQKEASYTVELSLLMPVIVFVLIAPIYVGYDLYGQTKEVSGCSWEAEFCADRRVRSIKLMEDIQEALK